MKFCINTTKNDDWHLETNDYDSQHLNKFESLMFQGNGYFGMRAASEERQLNEKRDMFVSGTFDAFADEVTELPNLPDLLNMEIKVNDIPLCLKDGAIENYHKSLNLKDGELVREFDWVIDHNRINFKFSRFVSMADLHLFVSKLDVTTDDDIDLQISSGVDGQVSNSETQHLIEGDKRLYDGQYIQYCAQTQQSKIDMFFNVRHELYINNVSTEKKPLIKMGRRQIFANYDINLNGGQTLTFVKYATVFTSIDKHLFSTDLQASAIEHLKEVSLLSYQELLAESVRVWEKQIWQRNLVKITAPDNQAQIAVNFARYQLATNTPLDARMNIGAKGITGEGYKGHTFWDTEIFLLPYYIFTMPEVARDLLKYRYLGLAGAHKKAHANGYQGAQFPWEAAWPEDGETTPLWGSADIVTGKPMKIQSGFIEQHVTSDIVIAITQYLHATNDQDFADSMGYEIILDAAKFWSSRLEYNSEKERFEINDVIGPDEYKEHANNNAFTNYTAYMCLKKAIEVTDELRDSKPGLYSKLDRKLDLATTYPEWVLKVDQIYLPQPNGDGVVPQDDEYLQKQIIDVAKYQSNEHVSDIFKDFNLEQIDQLQVTKQADVLLLIYLFDNLFNEQTKLANWNYYEPKTTHDSSLSLSTHAILATDLNFDDKAYNFFEKACEIDLGTQMGKADKGLHMASLGGIWNMIVEGFGGVRIVEQKLRIEPHLPKTWQDLQYQINWHGSQLRVTVESDKFTVEVKGSGVEFVSHGQTYQIADNSKLAVAVPTVEMKI